MPMPSTLSGTESTVFVPEPKDLKVSGTKQGIVVPEWSTYADASVMSSISCFNNSIATTAYDEYALKAFDYDCIDYLLKPYDLKDLEDALGRYEKRMPSTHVDDSRRVASRLFAGHKTFRSRLELNRIDSTIIVDTQDICYVEYDLGNVKVFCRNGMYGTTPLPLTRLAAELNPARFIKVSRTHIVNLEEILMIKPTLRRNKTLVLKEPYENVNITVTSEMIRELRQLMDVGKFILKQPQKQI